MDQLTSLFARKNNGRAEQTIRNVYANDTERNKHFQSNVICNTKYTLINFLPKNLYEQFSRPMNIYFLFIAILQLFPEITPVNPLSTWGALVFIFAVSAIKEVFDDLNRRRRDSEANSRLYSVVRESATQQVRSSEIRVGDIVYLTGDREIPSDLLILATSNEDGSCYIQTANLDGETDLKSRMAPAETRGYSMSDLSKFRGVVECPGPNSNIYSLDARMSVVASRRVNTYTQSDWVVLDTNNFVLQATQLRNTDHMYGLCVYSGNETKMGQNKKGPPTKWTKLDHAINRVTIIIFTFQLLLVVIFGAIGESVRHNDIHSLWYLGYSSTYKSPWYEFIIIPLRFLLLNSMMIPVSLKVTIDVIKYCYALFINWDINMYNANTDQAAVANSTALSEDLGQVEHLFTDKTGTLTENIMLLKRCSIDSRLHTSMEDGQLLGELKAGHQPTLDFFTSLALCHSVFPSTDHDGKLLLRASSPDEEALVKAAAALNITFTTRSSSRVTVDIQGQEHQYTPLHTFEFTSERKRMSVVLRDQQTGQIKLITKGADDAIIPRLTDKKPGGHLNVTNAESLAHIEEFAAEGLRTLCISSRVISEQEYQSWHSSRFQPASMSIENRQQMLFDAYERLERDLVLLGITAIEDRLQPFVPETISSLRQANIKVWMLTGDKYSTAIQIGHACNLIEKDCKVYTIGTPGQQDVAAKDILNSIRQIEEDLLVYQQSYQTDGTSHERPKATIVIEGHTLHTALIHVKRELLALADLSTSVICCRVTPEQKAQVVRMVKDTGKVCLSIGDGGNDVSMIQEANIGVGISGREGLQAARAADYSISRFKHLQELLFVHGRYSYLRTSFVANYSFYKSLCICFIQILYQFFSGYAGSSFFNTFSLTAYNILFTGLPVMGYILDKDLPASVVRLNPFLYSISQESTAFNWQSITRWGFRAAFQSILIFAATAGPFAFTQGSTIDYGSFSMVSFTALILLQSLTLFFESHTITWINHALIWGTIPLYILCLIVLNAAPTMDTYSVMTHLVDTASFWTSLVLALAICVLPSIALDHLLQIIRPTTVELVNQIRCQRRAFNQKDRLLQYGDNNSSLNSFNPLEAGCVKLVLCQPGTDMKPTDLILVDEDSYDAVSDDGDITPAGKRSLSFSDTDPLLP
ncbi:hypothetical protein SAMD00019534_072050 [Acytostelium subglobosum LB1]|uniref:hypothetical protein n=1 Tax=Acytostelium subglobosum LB1 TaxID=1410327 RepID=UPI00064483C1|nr:hypothetical protein SAMD00019534_072050 [Acytostelium subglobosum LB1]GAM24030.1 hypothetical protein SAMD00019534_072050 [Acytostelium subglobosum LB1]|eukprot:XP_012753066.1 hypothetical protein SAMD00019534_072050 [Acytostelium subglobosum LB1]